jgi:pimeloyl-ACP methyl ester carboxylesterase
MEPAHHAPRPLQIASHPHNNSLVLLVHGIMSTRFAAWESAIDMIQDIYFLGSGRGAFASYDYYAFGYKSGWIFQPSIDGSFERLRAFLSRSAYDSVVLVGHSQGGVVAKLFIVNELLSGRGQELNVDIVITLDTPHRGPKVWFYPLVVVGGVWKRLPWLNRIPLFRQLGELGRWSRNLKKLRDNWNERLIAPAPMPASSSCRHVRSYAVVGTRLPFLPTKLVVSNHSAEGFEIDELMKLDTGGRVALGLGHGVTAMAAYREKIEQILSNHDYENVAQVQKEMTAATQEQFRDELPGCAPADLDCEVKVWRRRIVEGFPKRPLRRLQMPQALRAFMTRRLENP